VDGGNGVVSRNWLLSRMPEPLADIVKIYQEDRQLPSFSYAIKELLETHPEIARRVNTLYTVGSESPD